MGQWRETWVPPQLQRVFGFNLMAFLFPLDKCQLSMLLLNAQMY